MWISKEYWNRTLERISELEGAVRELRNDQKINAVVNGFGNFTDSVPVRDVVEAIIGHLGVRVRIQPQKTTFATVILSAKANEEAQ